MANRMLALTRLCVIAGLLLLPVKNQGLVIEKDRFHLVTESVSIVTGEVVGLRTFWNKGKEKRIYTEVSVEVSEYLKGDEGRVVRFTVPGGTVDDVTMTMSEAPSFTEGEKVLLFLKKEDCRLAGWYQGKYIIEENMAFPAGPGCQVKLDENWAIPLEDLLQEIRLLVAVGPIEPFSN